MENSDFGLMLFDRLEIIKTAYTKYDLENKSYLSFSGGKDSAILSHLLDMAIPNNKIPRVFIDTGIEYKLVRDFVIEQAEKDERFVIIKPSTPIIPMLKKYGYPFKSKAHAHNVSIYQHSGLTKAVKNYLGIIGKATKFKCPKMFQYQFTEQFKLKISEQCCNQLKKKPVKKWEKENNRFITLTGMRREEGGNRAELKGCILTDKNGNVKKFHPLLVVTEEWEEEYIKQFSVELSKIYSPPYNFKRSGCKFCPFALDLGKQLEVAYRLMPEEAKMGEIIWKPVFDEYRRLNYRLKKTEQIKLF